MGAMANGSRRPPAPFELPAVVYRSQVSACTPQDIPSTDSAAHGLRQSASGYSLFGSMQIAANGIVLFARYDHAMPSERLDPL